MNTDFEKSRQIFLAIVEQPSTQWDALLDEACGKDSELHRQVALLLKAHAEGEGILDRNEALKAPTGIYESLNERPGTVIGPYKLLQQIGEGGMGTVWMAEQTHPVQRKLAVKLIKPGMDSRQVLARFEAERQALALMDHPNIAKVLDAGTIGSEPEALARDSAAPLAHASGSARPYFVMELVKGVPITKYCDEHHLTPKQRLELFIPVCQAVQHAHQKGIIHRDLKPNNVLVAEYDDKPVAKVIDFGVAKATGPRLTDRTMVLLYELLTGTTPFEKKHLQAAAFDEVLRIIREDDPPKPSTRLSTTDELPSIAANRGLEPKKLSGLVRGELDWIVMKSLEKDRNRRYETANGFAAEVQRYLNDEPVQAGPPSATYRLRKFARRNKRALATGAVLFLALLIALGAVAGSVGWMMRDQEARRAKLASQLEVVLEEVEQQLREQNWAEALAAARRAEALVAGGGGDAVLRQQVSAALVDLILVKDLEEIRLNRDVRLKRDGSDTTPADRQADGQYAAAFLEYGVDLNRLSEQEAIRRLQSRPHVTVALAIALDDWTNCRIGKGDVAGARMLGAVARGIDADAWRTQVRAAWAQEDWKALEGLAASPEFLRQPPPTLHLLGMILGDGGKLESGIEVLRKTQARYPGDFWINYHLGVKLRVKGPAYLEQAIGFSRAALALRPQSAGTWTTLGSHLMRQKKPDEAITYFSKAIELDPKYADAHNGLGAAFHSQKMLDDAIACYNKAIEVDPKIIMAYCNVGIALRGQGKLEEAVEWFNNPKYKAAIPGDPKDRSYRLHWLNNRMFLCMTLLSMKDHRQLAMAGRELADTDYQPEKDVYEGAIWVAKCVSLAEKDARLAEGQRKELVQAYAAQAIDILKQAVARGYKNARGLSKEPAFAPLRSREDFQKLVAEVDAKKK
ncbi:MAG: tetratricopeptide repeat protein [Planctomycetes bacterium]|nr:tetratricopeptide repeat protein [Planctomycetota bacterium]